MIKNKWIKYSVICAIVLVCLGLDQLSKVIAINNLVELNSVPVINNFFYFTLCYNTGGAWSIFSNATWVLALISIVALGVIIYSLVKSRSKLYLISASIFAGGLIGNLIDRLFKGKVTDFLDFKIFGYDFPVFNIADSFIVVSAIIIVIAFIVGDKDEKSSN